MRVSRPGEPACRAMCMKRGGDTGGCRAAEEGLGCGHSQGHRDARQPGASGGSVPPAPWPWACRRSIVGYAAAAGPHLGLCHVWLLDLGQPRWAPFPGAAADLVAGPPLPGLLASPISCCPRERSPAPPRVSRALGQHSPSTGAGPRARLWKVHFEAVSAPALQPNGQSHGPVGPSEPGHWGPPTHTRDPRFLLGPVGSDVHPLCPRTLVDAVLCLDVVSASSGWPGPSSWTAGLAELGRCPFSALAGHGLALHRGDEARSSRLRVHVPGESGQELPSHSHTGCEQRGCP